MGLTKQLMFEEIELDDALEDAIDRGLSERTIARRRKKLNEHHKLQRAWNNKLEQLGRDSERDARMRYHAGEMTREQEECFEHWQRMERERERRLSL